MQIWKLNSWLFESGIKIVGRFVNMAMALKRYEKEMKITSLRFKLEISAFPVGLIDWYSRAGGRFKNLGGGCSTVKPWLSRALSESSTLFNLGNSGGPVAPLVHPSSAGPVIHILAMFCIDPEKRTKYILRIFRVKESFLTKQQSF